MKMILAAIAVLALSSCATLDSQSSTLINVAEDARDRVGNAALDYICNHITIREWREKFGRHRAGAQGWALICSSAVAIPPVAPALPSRGPTVPQDDGQQI